MTKSPTDTKPAPMVRAGAISMKCSLLGQGRAWIVWAVMASVIWSGGLITVAETPPTDPIASEVIVYGGTSAGVIAAVKASRLGRSVTLVCPEIHLGGLSSSGLGWTDTGDKSVIGGLSREFYHRVWKHYQEPDAWRWQPHEAFGNRGQGTAAIDAGRRTQWVFEPHVAEVVFEEMLADSDVRVDRDEWLDRNNGVALSDRRIASIRTLSGKTYKGLMFIDATYEGDLMAAAGVDYHVGREAREVYDEQWNGVQVGVLHHSHYFAKPVDPHVTPGDPTSGGLRRPSGQATRGGSSGPGLLLSHVPLRPPREQAPLPTAFRVRRQPVRPSTTSF